MQIGDLLPARLTPPLPAGLLDRARDLATTHATVTGRDITRDELRDALHVSNALAGDVLRALRPTRTTTPTVQPTDTAALNGHLF